MPDDNAANLRRILESPSYRVAYKDVDFLMRPEMRAARLELELLKPDLYLREHNIRSTIVVFGSTQIVEPAAARRRLEEAQNATGQIARRPAAAAGRGPGRTVCWSEATTTRSPASSPGWFPRPARVEPPCDYVIVTGGGPGIMEAANRGAYDVGAKSVGLNIRLPHEQQPNPYITPDLCFQFHYFAMRKLHFLLRAKALVAFPGGFGTLDELFDALTLRQTGRMQAIPIILVGREYWQQVIDFQFLADQGTVADEDLDLLDYAETRGGSLADHSARSEGNDEDQG